MKEGFVALVGAGPGDSSLITLKGLNYLKKAEVVFYDRLVSAEILNLISPKAKKIPVGKESNNHSVKQENINELISDEAMKGHLVVRLKGGDPFLFGRGGEELELLAKRGIKFEVVPGITSAIAGPAYAGIPVTHRDFCSSVHIITGHQKQNEPLNINFNALVEIGGTLIFLMGVASLKQIIDGLVRAGIEKKMPCVIVENGTQPFQRKILGTVENIYEKSVACNVKSPAIIIVGEVCSLSDKYDWFSKRALNGKKIIVTRPKRAGGILSDKLRDLGAEVIEFPCIDIKENTENAHLDKVFQNLRAYKWLVFTSKIGVEIFWAYLKKAKKDARALYGLKIAAIGSQTANSLKDYGVIADYVPKIYDGQNLANGLCQLTGEKDKILLARSQQGSSDILEIFAKNQKKYEDVALYETVFVDKNKEQIDDVLKNNSKIFVTFTSASTVEGFVKAVNEVNLKNIIGICIGEQTASAAQKYGIKHQIAKKATIDMLILKILEVQNV